MRACTHHANAIRSRSRASVERCSTINFKNNFHQRVALTRAIWNCSTRYSACTHLIIFLALSILRRFAVRALEIVQQDVARAPLLFVRALALVNMHFSQQCERWEQCNLSRSSVIEFAPDLGENTSCLNWSNLKWWSRRVNFSEIRLCLLIRLQRLKYSGKLSFCWCGNNF